MSEGLPRSIYLSPHPFSCIHTQWQNADMVEYSFVWRWDSRESTPLTWFHPSTSLFLPLSGHTLYTHAHTQSVSVLKSKGHFPRSPAAPMIRHRHSGRQRGNKEAGLSFLTPSPIQWTHTHTVWGSVEKALTWVYANCCMQMCVWRFKNSTSVDVVIGDS